MIARITQLTLLLALCLALVVVPSQVRAAFPNPDTAEVYAALELALEEAPGHLRASLRKELRKVCKRESRCDASVSVHAVDGWSGQRFHARAVAKGWLDPERCEAHTLSDDPAAWAPRGAWGVSPAWTLRYADDEDSDGERDCWGPEAHDDPYKAAKLTVRWALGLRRGGYSTCEDRVRVWVGVGHWQKLSEAQRREKIAKQCPIG